MEINHSELIWSHFVVPLPPLPPLHSFPSVNSRNWSDSAPLNSERPLLRKAPGTTCGTTQIISKRRDKLCSPEETGMQEHMVPWRKPPLRRPLVLSCLPWKQAHTLNWSLCFAYGTPPGAGIIPPQTHLPSGYETCISHGPQGAKKALLGLARQLSASARNQAPQDWLTAFLTFLQGLQKCLYTLGDKGETRMLA